jgi:dihydrolipoamide dehydrogenase
MTNSSVESVDTSGDGVKATVKTKKGEETIRSRYFTFCSWN